MARPFVFDAMGTTGSLRGAVDIPDDVQTAVRALFEEWEERFSLFRESSEMSQVNRREVLMTRASAEMRRAYEHAEHWRSVTDGAFQPVRPDGLLDLGGVVKAMAMQATAELLSKHYDLHDWCFNMGGDVVVDGIDRQPGGADRPWTVGIVDPQDRRALLSQVECGDVIRAVATSGTRERGEHIWRLGDSTTFCQATVAGPDIETVDALATAILAGGKPTMDYATAHYPVEVLAVTEAGGYYATDVFLDIE